MKTLYIIRHAKSSWGDFTTTDFDRPLNDRGKKDAPEMARRLVKRHASIDIFVSSPAKRALTTCMIFCKEYGVATDSIVTVDALYHAPKEIFYNTISQIDNRFNSACIFSHNPGITDFINNLGTKTSLDNMPTCAVFAVSSDIDEWKMFGEAQKQFLFFDYPKSASQNF